ncbi:hypothetical protein C2G38_2120157 [Gigaspora rosea]|uniref:Uncharacterized protein n=1 Tax=Gigaspora rosea TaxID=44941 RepID=A0A397U344_9GLOM|nr:hypothetical protein C2G38_2120157 [Gigaspora rosea]
MIIMIINFLNQMHLICDKVNELCNFFMTDESLTPTNDDDFKLYNKVAARRSKFYVMRTKKLTLYCHILFIRY